MQSDDTKIEGINVMLTSDGKCWLSYLVYFASLDDARKTGQLGRRVHAGAGVYFTIPPHTLLLITQWAKARGFTKERHVIKKKDRVRIRA